MTTAPALQDLAEKNTTPDNVEKILPCEVSPYSKALKKKGLDTKPGLPNEFHPEGLNQTYRDNDLQAQLPKFAVIDAFSEGTQRFEILRPFFEIEWGELFPKQKINHGKEHITLPKAERGELNHKVPSCRFFEDSTNPEILNQDKEKRKLQNFRKWAKISTIPATLLATIGCAIGLGWTHLPLSSWQCASAVLTIFAVCTCLAKVINLFYSSNLEKTVVQEFCYTLPGLIPPKVREKIQAESKNYDRIWLICDAENQWTSPGAHSERPAKLDPLVIGEKNHRYFLLDAFNLTPAEDYLANEFSTKQ